MPTHRKTFKNGGVMIALACGALVAWGEPLSLISWRDVSQAPPTPGNGDSWAPILTPDGRYVAFASTADNLVTVNGTNSLPNYLSQKQNVFLRDRSNGFTTLVSVNLAGTGGGDGDSLPTAISGDGHYVLLESLADNLVPGDTNGWADVFLRDVWSNRTLLISVSTNGGAGNGVSRGSTLTPDGRYVAFTSAASNLVALDTNGLPDVFVRDWQNGITTLASVGALPASADNLIGSESPELSDEGRYVVFYSTATNLVAGVTNSGEIYIRDLVAGTTTWASAGAHEFLGATTVSFNHALSTNGNFVAYEACTNPPFASGVYQGIVLRFSQASGLTDIVSTNAYAPAANLEDFHDLSLTPDGRFIAFIANTNAGFNTAVFLWDAQSGFSSLVSGDLTGAVPTNTVCDWPAVDPAGRFVTFLSNAPGLVTNALTDDFHLYRKDMQAGAMTLIDADTNGAGVGVGSAAAPQMSDDGTLVAFEAPDASLVAGDRNHAFDVFVRNVVAGTNELISPRDPAFPSATPNGLSSLAAFCSSTNGRWVVFASEADNLVPADTNGFRDIFVRDQLGGSNLLMSASTNGVPGDGISSEPAISADGRSVVFTSAADNLVAGDTNDAPDVFVCNLPDGPTALVSINVHGTGPGNNGSGSPLTSADGNVVLFNSLATDLTTDAISPNQINLFLRDLGKGTTYALTTAGTNSSSMTPDGQLIAFTDQAGGAAGRIYVWDIQAAARVKTNKVAGGVSSISISPDGNRIAFLAGSPGRVEFVDQHTGSNGPISSGFAVGSRVGLRFSADGRFLTYSAIGSNYITGTNQIFVYDFKARTETCVSTAFGSTNGANAGSDSPDISADGRFVAYRSFAGNILSGSTGTNVPELYLYDRLSGTTALLTASRLTGGPANNRSRTPVFSPGGRTLFCASWASDLAPLDFNGSGDVFALAFLYLSITPPETPGVGPTLSWPARPGETYRVQFLDDLNAPVWQPVNFPVTITGDQATLTDSAPGSGARFYRVVAQ